MLKVATDLDESGWLVYILEEFGRLSDAEFKIEIQSLDSYSPDSGTPVIFYTREPQSGPTICNRHQADPDLNLIMLKEGFYVYEQSLTAAAGFETGYDILWNAFLLLSRYEEYSAEKRGTSINSYCSKHPRKESASFEVPMVNWLFRELEKLISDQFPALTFGPGEKLQIELSHDLDYIRKTPQLRIKQTAMNGWNTTLSIGHPRSFSHNLSKTFQFLFSNPSYWCFDYWTALESSYNYRSTFYIYAKTEGRSATQWLLDPSYDVSKDEKLQNQLKELIAEGFQIGLHGSFESAGKLQVLKKEKEVLENAINYEVIKTRQHWLRYRESITPYIHEQLFEYDSSLGWNDRIGFRSGCCSLHHPFDHENQRSFKHMEIPQVIMDSTIYDYGNDQIAHWENKCRTILSDLEVLKNVHIALSWHPRVCCNDYNWHLFYEELLKNMDS